MPVQRLRDAIAHKLASKVRELEPAGQLLAVSEWRVVVDEIAGALKAARRARAQRERAARREGRTRRPEIPGITSAIFDAMGDYIIEGAIAGARREVTADDAPAIAEAHKRLEAAMVSVVRATLRGTTERRLALAAMPLHAVAVGYWQLRGSFGDAVGDSLDVLDAVRNTKPAVKVAMLALAELGHSNAAIARALEVDSGFVRREMRAVRESYAEES